MRVRLDRYYIYEVYETSIIPSGKPDDPDDVYNNKTYHDMSCVIEMRYGEDDECEVIRGEFN